MMPFVVRQAQGERFTSYFRRNDEGGLAAVGQPNQCPVRKRNLQGRVLRDEIQFSLPLRAALGSEAQARREPQDEAWREGIREMGKSFHYY